MRKHLFNVSEKNLDITDFSNNKCWIYRNIFFDNLNYGNYTNMIDKNPTYTISKNEQARPDYIKFYNDKSKYIIIKEDNINDYSNELSEIPEAHLEGAVTTITNDGLIAVCFKAKHSENKTENYIVALYDLLFELNITIPNEEEITNNDINNYTLENNPLNNYWIVCSAVSSGGYTIAQTEKEYKFKDTNGKFHYQLGCFPSSNFTMDEYGYFVEDNKNNTSISTFYVEYRNFYNFKVIGSNSIIKLVIGNGVETKDYTNNTLNTLDNIDGYIRVDIIMTNTNQFILEVR